MKQQQFENKVNKISSMLGRHDPSGFEVEFKHFHYRYVAHLRNGDQHLMIGMDRPEPGVGGRIEIDGCYPQSDNGNRPYNLLKAAITVTEKKNALQIVGSIHRRLMPRYLRGLEKAVAMVAGENAGIRKRLDNIQKAAEVVGIADAYISEGETTDPKVWFDFSGSPRRQVISLEQEDRYTMELHYLTLEQLRSIVGILRPQE